MSDETTLLDLEPEAPAEPMKADARVLVEMLRKHYQPEGRPPAGIFAPEIGSPDGKCRADAIWMPTTVAGGTGLHGHEIKVTRSDLLVELGDPTKADPWAQYCTHWWLVVASPRLVDGLVIPEAWGVMSPPSGRRTRTVTVVKPAPKRKPRDPAPGLARLATWLLHQDNGRIFDLERRRLVLERDLQYQRDRVRDLEAAGEHRGIPHAQKVSRILAAVNDAKRGANLWGELDEEAVVRSILDHAVTAEAAKRVRLQLRAVIGEVERIRNTDPFRYALDDLNKADQIAAGLVPDKKTRGVW